MSEQEKPKKIHYKRNLIVLALLSTISLVSLAFAATSWTQTFTWSTPQERITIYKDAEHTQEWSSGDTVPLGVLSGEVTKTFYVVNNGNIELSVIPSTTTISGATAEWDNPTGTLLQPQESTTFTLTLIITEPGSCTVTIS